MKPSIAIIYTGDVRHNQEIKNQNHQMLFDRIYDLCDYNIYDYTRNSPRRGVCPYDPVDELPDKKYRRGQGGAVQVWDFLNGVSHIRELYVLKLRTDIWFTEDSVDTIISEFQKVLWGDSDIVFFGSDLVNNNAGVTFKRYQVDINIHGNVQDFVVLASKIRLRSLEDTVAHINALVPNKRRSGNKMFRYIIPISGELGDYTHHSIAHNVLCPIFLIRNDYTQYPTDLEVERDYIQSYIVDDKSGINKKTFIFPHPMQDAVNSWRVKQGMTIKQITEDWRAWQKP